MPIFGDIRFVWIISLTLTAKYMTLNSHLTGQQRNVYLKRCLILRC